MLMTVPMWLQACSKKRSTKWRALGCSCRSDNAHDTDFSVFQWLLVLRGWGLPPTRSRSPPPPPPGRPEPAVATLVTYGNQYTRAWHHTQQAHVVMGSGEGHRCVPMAPITMTTLVAQQRQALSLHTPVALALAPITMSDWIT